MAEIFSQFFMVISLIMAAIGGAAVADTDGFDRKAHHMEKMEHKLDIRLVMVDACMADENCDAFGEDLPEIQERLTERLANLDACREKADSCQKKSDWKTHDNLTEEERAVRHAEKIDDQLELVQSCMANDECHVDDQILEKIESHLLMKKQCLENGDECRKGMDRRHHMKHDRGPAMKGTR